MPRRNSAQSVLSIPRIGSNKRHLKSRPSRAHSPGVHCSKREGWLVLGGLVGLIGGRVGALVRRGGRFGCLVRRGGREGRLDGRDGGVGLGRRGLGVREGLGNGV